VSKTKNHDDKTLQPENSSETSSTGITPAMVEKFVIRLPQGLREQIKTLSEQNRRSMNSEIILVLEKHIQQNRDIDMDDLSIQDFPENNVRPHSFTQQELNKRLESLPPEKQEALLELLG